jgi:hypothetical protein
MRYPCSGEPLFVTHKGLQSLRLHKVDVQAKHNFGQYLCHLGSLEELYVTHCRFSIAQPGLAMARVHPSLRHIAAAIDHTADSSLFSMALPKCPRLKRISIRTIPGGSRGYPYISSATSMLPQFVASCRSGNLTLDLSRLSNCALRVMIDKVGAEISELFVEDLWTAGEVLKTFVERNVAPPRVLVTREPPKESDEVRFKQWLGSHLSFRQRLPGMNIYSPVPLHDAPGSIGQCMALCHQSDFGCIFLGQEEIDRMLGEAWDREEQTYSWPKGWYKCEVFA